MNFHEASTGNRSRNCRMIASMERFAGAIRVVAFLPPKAEAMLQSLMSSPAGDTCTLRKRTSLSLRTDAPAPCSLPDSLAWQSLFDANRRNAHFCRPIKQRRSGETQPRVRSPVLSATRSGIFSFSIYPLELRQGGTRRRSVDGDGISSVEKWHWPH
jgi:hypothetical protein